MSIDGGDQNLLDLTFRHRARVAEQTRVFELADAALNHRFFAPIIPMNPAIKLSAGAAENDVRQAVGTAEVSFFAVLTGMNASVAHPFFLHLHENLARNNPLVDVFHVILRNKTVVLNPQQDYLKEKYNVNLTDEKEIDPKK